MRTWMIELAVVACVLLAVAIMSGKDVEILAAIAVTLTFAHAQVADRMAEQNAGMRDPYVECYWLSIRYFVTKEAVWAIYFIYIGAWSALVGAGLFLLYPLWRKWWRS